MKEAFFGYKERIIWEEARDKRACKSPLRSYMNELRKGDYVLSYR